MRAIMLVLLCLAFFLALPASVNSQTTYVQRASYDDGFSLDASSESNFPGVFVNAAGDIFVADSKNNRVVVLYSNGTQKAVISGFSLPAGVAQNTAGDIYVADSGHRRVVVLYSNGTRKAVIDTNSVPQGVALNAAGNIIVGELGSQVVVLFSNGTQKTVINGFSTPLSVAVNAAGDIIVAEAGGRRVVVLYSNGTQKAVINGFNSPSGVATNTVGDIFVADAGGVGRVVVLYSNGTQKAVINGFSQPAGVALDAAGNVYVSDADTNQVLVFSPLPAALSSSATPSSSTSSSSSATPLSSATPSSSVIPSSSAASSSVIMSSSATPSSSASSSSSAPSSSLSPSSSVLPSSSFPPAPSSSTAIGQAYSDPRIVGFWGQNQYVAGKDGEVYSMLLDGRVAVNARFVLLEAADIHCPAQLSSYCVAERGTYFGEVGVVASNGDRLEVVAGAAEVGFRTVRLNGEPLLYEAQSSRDKNRLRGASERPLDGSQAQVENGLSVCLMSNRSLEFSVGVYSIQLDVIDRYLDFVSVNTHCWSCLLDDVRPEGLLGRTWDNSLEHATDDEAVEQYRETDGQLLGCGFGLLQADKPKACTAQKEEGAVSARS